MTNDFWRKKTQAQLCHGESASGLNSLWFLVTAGSGRCQPLAISAQDLFSHLPKLLGVQWVPSAIGVCSSQSQRVLYGFMMFYDVWCFFPIRRNEIKNPVTNVSGDCWLNHQPVGVARYLNVTISASSDGALVRFEMFCAFQQVTPHLYFTVYIPIVYIPIVWWMSPVISLFGVKT